MKLVWSSFTGTSKEMYLSGSSMPYTFCSRAIQKRLVSCFSSPRPFQSAANRAAAVRFSISVIVLPPQKGCCNQYTTPGQKWQSLMERASNASEYPFGYSDASCWGSPKPRTVRFASSRTRLTAWLLSLPLVAPSRTSAREAYGRYTGMRATAASSPRSSCWRCGQVLDRPPA